MKHIITIGRQFGSGGAEIGQVLAQKIGATCYDKDILLEAAKNSDIYEAIAEQFDEEGHQSYFYSLVNNGQVTKNLNYQPLNIKLHNELFQIIRNIAQGEESCVFIGRCADYVLADRDDLLSVCISGDLEKRVQRIAMKYEMSETEAYKLIQRRDNQRASYYNYYTNKKWSDISSYDLSLNSADLGIEGSVDLILKYLDLKERNSKDN